MSVFYWTGYVIGLLLSAAALLAPVVLLAVRPARRWWLRPLLRRVTGRRRPDQARIAGLQRELASLDN